MAGGVYVEASNRVVKDMIKGITLISQPRDMLKIFRKG